MNRDLFNFNIYSSLPEDRWLRTALRTGFVIFLLTLVFGCEALIFIGLGKALHVF